MSTADLRQGYLVKGQWLSAGARLVWAVIHSNCGGEYTRAGGAASNDTS